MDRITQEAYDRQRILAHAARLTHELTAAHHRLTTNRNWDFYRVHFQGYTLDVSLILWTKPRIVDDTQLSSNVGCIP